MMKKKGKPSLSEIEVSIDEFKPGTELEAVKGFKLGVYGNGGSGKTYLTLATGRKTLLIDTEGNARTIIQQFPKEIRENVLIKEIKTSNDDGDIDFPLACDRFEAAVKTACKFATEHPEDDYLIVIDSISEYWEWLSIWLTMQTDLARSQSGKMIQTEWGRPNKRHANILAMLKNTECDIILIGKAHPVFGDGGKMLDVNDPKWQKGIPFWADICGELSFDGVDTKFKITKNRFGRFYDVISDADYVKIKEHITEKSGVKFD
jgi:hypothetical protein